MIGKQNMFFTTFARPKTKTPHTERKQRHHTLNMAESRATISQQRFHEAPKTSLPLGLWMKSNLKLSGGTVKFSCVPVEAVLGKCPVQQEVTVIFGGY
jgi:hypothetical protein